jgi:fibrillarin-like pre-rRNA processing protein
VHTRSKIAAYIRLGGRYFPFSEDSQVLYLGAASGTTASHISDIVTSGAVYCVEFSPRSFRDLVGVCDARPNMVPLMGDATQPSGYDFAIDRIDVVYQDVAQRDQVSILVRNMDHFRAGLGMMALKSRSEDVSRDPGAVYREMERMLGSRGMRVIETLPLDPHERDHAMMVVERG